NDGYNDMYDNEHDDNRKQLISNHVFFFFQAEDGIRDRNVTGVQTCALPISGGEGGATLINDKALIERAEIIREKGTNRSQFFRGQVDKYTWRDIGSSYLMSDLQAAYLWAQLEAADRINQQRLALWQNYYDALAPLAKAGRIELPSIPDGCVQNAHMFYIKLRDIDDRSALINFLKEAEIMAVFHYIPLHGCPAGERFGEFHGEDRYTTKESERLLRLPLFYNLSPVNQRTVLATLLNYFS